jgi:SAM-dependent methyltransferase
VPLLDRRAALDWIARWDIQQLGYLPDREERFTALIDAVEEGTQIPDPLVLDLGCGPGSLDVRLLDRLPGATVVGVDADPLLLTLGRIAWPGRAGLRFAETDLRTAGWSAALGLDRKADAAVSTTALHWLPGPALAAMYAELGTVLRPGGLLLNGDHFREDDTAPTLARLGRALIEREESRRFPGGHQETWSDWWDAVTAEPALAEQAAARASRMIDNEHHGSPSGLLSTHVNALRAAGSSRRWTIWQRGENRRCLRGHGRHAASTTQQVSRRSSNR